MIPIITKRNLIILSIFLATFSIYFFTSAGNTPYDYFTRLANAFLHGKYYITENPPWLSELIPLGGHRFTFVNPPMPAILAIPFVFVFRNFFEQQYLANILGAASVIGIGLVSWKIKKDKALAIWSSLLLGFGGIFWYLSATGSVWYLGQVTSVFFLTFAILESLDNKRPFLVSCLFSAALFSRLQIVMSLPFFVFLLRDKFNKKNIILFLIPLFIFAISYFSYNYLRFGNPLQNGYTLIPGILKEPWFDHGQFSLFYIPKHLQLLLLQGPKTINKFPFIEPSWAGLAIWITSPAFIFAFFAPIKKGVVIMSWITIFLIGLINFSYGSTGFSQFGYRYAVDFYPFLIFLTISGVSQKKLKWYHWLFLSIGIIVNAWGVLWINKFGWVGF